MIKLEETKVLNWEAAIRGMRNPKNSWDKSDSVFYYGQLDTPYTINGVMSDPVVGSIDSHDLALGPNDHKLMMQLARAGSDHRKYMRQIFVSVDITAPLYWWKEFDTYKVGTVANSCSTMHTIHAKEFELDDFSHEHLISNWNGDNLDAFMHIPTGDEYELNGEVHEDIMLKSPIDALELIVGILNNNREAYLKTKDKKYWWQMIQLLPSSYNQKRTVTMNYENLANMYKSRKNHKLDEWHVLCDWVKDLPYSEIITLEETGEEH